MQGAAGSSYLSWQEGNWNLTVRAVNQENQDPEPVAKKNRGLFRRSYAARSRNWSNHH